MPLLTKLAAACSALPYVISIAEFEFEKMPIQQTFARNDYIPEQTATSNQLNLFEF